MNINLDFVKSKILGRQNLRKALNNISWLFLGKILQIILGFFVAIWIARYFGPEQLGLFNYALAFTGLFGAIATLGLKDIVVRDITHNPDDAKDTLVSAAALMLIGGFIAYFFIIITITYMRPEDKIIRTMVAIMGSRVLFTASNTVVFWFESQLQSKYIVSVESFSFLLFAIIKVFLILQNAPLIAFVWLILIEAFLIAFLLFCLIAIKDSFFTRLSVSFKFTKKLLKDSWPNIFAGIAVTIYFKVDQIMLGNMIGNESVGIYSVAARISEFWYFILIAITSSVFPRLVELFKLSKKTFDLQLLRLLKLINFLTLFIGLFIYLFSEPFIQIFFGTQYLDAAEPLKVLGWGGFFVGIGLVRTKYLTLMNLLNYKLCFLIFGAFLNVLLNIYLIPIHQELGAAWATFISYFFIAFIGPTAFSKLRHFQFLLFKSIIINPKG